jgi:hypothetical protein
LMLSLGPGGVFCCSSIHKKPCELIDRMERCYSN